MQQASHQAQLRTIHQCATTFKVFNNNSPAYMNHGFQPTSQNQPLQKTNHGQKAL